MEVKSVVTYMPPKEKYIKVGRKIMKKFKPEVIGIYCMIIELSDGMSLSIPFIADRIHVSVKKVRKVIVLLEDEGYVVRVPIKDERGAYKGWNYCVYAEPVSKDRRSHAGKKSEPTDNGLTQKRTSPQSDMSENGKENIIIDNAISNNINNETIKEGIEENVPDGTSPTSEEEKYNDEMKKRFPRIMKMEQPLTLEQARKLKEKYDRDLLAKVMLDMENYRPLLKKSVSAYLTINKWCQMEMDRV